MKDYPIPEIAMENHIAILGKTGCGKTYAAKGMIERLLDKGARVCVIDPTSVYFGLKSKYKIPVFGGDHADLQLGQAHGEAIAEVVATTATSAIIDTSALRVGERARFFTDFAETLLRKNKTPLYLIIDESHLFMPQGKVADPRSGAMLHAGNNLVSLGRSKGLRITLISQRPAKLHKDSLTQVETLVAMRLIAPQDRKAVQEWIADQADIARGKEIVSDLPNLATGSAWLWSPGINILEKIKFPKISTFDSSSSNHSGKEVKLIPTDLAEIETKLAAIDDKIIKNDPENLKKRIKELENKLSNSDACTAAKVNEIEHKKYEEIRMSSYGDGWNKAFDCMFDGLRLAREMPENPSVNFLPKIKSFDVQGMKELAKIPGEIKNTSFTEIAENVRKTPVDLDNPSNPEKRIMDALAFWSGVGYPAPRREQVAAVAGYSPTSGGFQGLIGTMKTRGVLTIPAPGTISLTGKHYVRMDKSCAADMMLSFLSEPERKVLRSITHAHMKRGDIAKNNNYSPTSGGFQGMIGRLISLRILTKSGPGTVSLADWAEELLL